MTRRYRRSRRDFTVRVRGIRRATPDYQKLARVLLDHAAREEHARQEAEQKTDDKPRDDQEAGDGVA
jgi:hypothetical protein